MSNSTISYLALPWAFIELESHIADFFFAKCFNFLFFFFFFTLDFLKLWQAIDSNGHCFPLDACLECRKERRVLDVGRASTLNPHVLATLWSSVARTLRLKWDVKSTFRAHVSLQHFSEHCKNIYVPATAVWDRAIPATTLQTLMKLVRPINSLLPNPGDIGGYFLLWKGPINNLKPLKFLLRPPGCGDAGKPFLFWGRPSFSQLLLWCRCLRPLWYTCSFSTL
jgi:hypothetical protein